MLKKLLLFTMLVGSGAFQLFAQVPMQFNYQAVARDNKGIPLADKDIKVRFSIKKDLEEGAVEYMEIRKVHTNPFGMFNVSIGGEDAYFSSGSLNDVKWEEGKKYFGVEIDFTGNNNYLNMGSTQMVSVPYALFALKTVQNGSNIKASNGLQLKGDKLQFGNEPGDSTAQLMSNTVLPLNGRSLTFKDGKSEIAIQKEAITFQQDSALLMGDERNSGGAFLKINPIFPRNDALPFLFSRIATKQHNGASSPNEVVMWGHNLGGGGNAFIEGLPAIGYSLESNYKPSIDDRWLESHEYYITPKGQQVRLKSYTINTSNNHIDFYHSTDNLYIKNPRSAEEYFRVENAGENNFQLMSMGSFRIDVNNPNKQVQIQSLIPGSELYMLSNWRYIYMPGLFFQQDGTLHLTGNIVPENDGMSFLGGSGNRLSSISSLKYHGSNMILKQDWLSYDNIQSTATLDIEGLNGFGQLRLRKSFTPSSSNDTNGNVGDLSWDENYIYIKTESGWKRTSLTSF